MSDVVREAVRVEASPEDVMAVIADVEAYPSWQDEIKEAEVLAADAQGRPLRARLTVDAKLFTTTYVLGYDYPDGEMRWELEEGDQLRELTGRYVLEPDDGGTRVTYELTVVPRMRVPGVMRRQAARRIVDGALEAMRRRVEDGT
ncbi:MAG: SRPBCC family protein [Actinomycetota bacterium]